MSVSQQRIIVALVCFLSSAPLLAEPPNRIVRVVSISQDQLTGTDEHLLEATMDRLDGAASFRPDIACLPEVFLRETEETIPGDVTRRLAEWARKNSSYLIFGLKTRTGGKVYNSAVLLDRKGQVAGQYDKQYPTEAELRKGIAPGKLDPPVFKTDFGAIGIQICFDVNWWESWKLLKEKGAEIVFFPAAYPAASQTAVHAMVNGYYVVSSTMGRAARIHDITGRTLSSSGRFQQWAGAALPLGKRLFEIDYHVAKIREMQKKYGSKVEVTWYHDDDWFTLASLDPELTVSELITEFDLTPLDQYRQRAQQAVEAARSTSP